MAEATRALELSFFAYLSVPRRPADFPRVISTYPSAWTEHYVRNRYERFDPVIMQALSQPEPFAWGIEMESRTLSQQQQQLFEEARGFGIQIGFTIPIHDNRGPVSAVTFAADRRRSHFERSINEDARVLQFMAKYFHAWARRHI